MADKNAVLSTATVQDHLSRMLPDYMIPAALLAMDAFPKMQNGKLDKRALPEPDFSTLAEAYVAPATAEEQALCTIWQEVLGIERVGASDNFFRIGGNSILAIQVSHRINKALGWNVKVADIFRFPVCSRLALCNSQKKSVTYIEGEL